MKIKHLLCALVVLLSVPLQAQELHDPAPPSPTAFGLGRFGEIPVGMFNGSQNVGVPLYTYTTKNLSVPISLSYSNNGIRVGQLSSWVGLGWNLNIGGVITRNTKGKADEFSQEVLDFPNKQIAEFNANPTVIHPTVSEFIYNQTYGLKDGEHDVYNFNFQGYTGRFVHDSKDRLVLLDHNAPLKITETGHALTKEYQITDPAGIKYTFASIERTKNTNSCLGGSSSNPPLYPITAWYLTKIEHPLGDVIDFTYTTGTYIYTAGSTESFRKSQGNVNGCSCPSDSASNCDQIVTVSALRLSEISSNNPNDGKVELQSNLSHPEIANYKLLENIKVKNAANVEIERFTFNYSFTTNDRAFLDNVTFKDPDQKYSFSYISKDQFPDRFSYKQDHWGYYNGSSNNNLLIRPPGTLWSGISSSIVGADREPDAIHTEKGLLERVTYPTGGYTDLEYEANSYYSSGFEYTSVYHAVNTDPISGLTSTITFTTSADYSNDTGYETEISAGPSLDNILCTTNCTNIGTVTLTDLSNSQVIFTETVYNDFENTINQNVTLQENTNYELKIIKATGNNNFQASVRHYDRSTVTANYSGPGVRVKKTTMQDVVGGNVVTKRYHYAELTSLNQSSGKKWSAPTYLEETFLNCNSSSIVICPYITLSSNTVSTAVDERGPMIYYPYVSVSLGGDDFEAGAEVHEYEYNQISNNNAMWSTYGYSPSIRLNNQDAANNGREKKVSHYRKDGPSSFTKLYEKENVFVEDSGFYQSVPNYVSKKEYDIIGPETLITTLNYECQAADVTKRYPYGVCTASHEHFWKFLGSNTLSCVAPGHNNQTQYWNHPCYGKAVGYVIPDSGQPILAGNHTLQYDHVSQRYFLDSSIESYFDENGQNPVTKTTKYYYDNPEHLQVTRTEVTDSRGDTLLTKTFFPDDVSGLTGLGGAEQTDIERLGYQDLHQVVTPIQTEVYRDGQLLSKQRTLFNDWGSDIVQPEKMLTQKGSGSLEERIAYNDYDTQGNPLEVNRTDGSKQSYIWGYGKKLLIAKVENASYSEIASALGITVAVLKNYNETNMSNINGLRSSLPNAMITTYEYDPMIGLTDVTDPKGYKTTYEYDSYNRLRYVKDADGNPISENTYNFKGN